MVSRFIIHSKNLHYSLKWIFYNYNKLRKQLESQGYYSIQVCKIFLWKKTSKYFKVFDESGKIFFVKVQSADKVLHEYQAFQHMESYNLGKSKFYPRIFCYSTGLFSYNIFEELDGKRINKRMILDFDFIKQFLDIVLFFDKVKMVHRDIRPHNIIVVNKKVKIIDFEHCSINNKKADNNSKELNKYFSPNNRVWDDAYSFKKILDYYIGKDKLKDSESYERLSKMIGKNIYECD